MTSVALASTYSTGGQFVWTCPPGVTSVQVVCTAGGGGGSAAPSGTAGSNSGGGGGGESCYEPFVPVTPGVQYQVNVGAGGIGGITGGVEVGDVGGDSFFTGDGSFLAYAHGGQPGLASTTGGGRGGAGGDGSQNIVSAAGGRGANAVASSNSGGGGGAAGVSTTAGFPGNNAVGVSGGPTSGGTYAGGAGGAGLSTSGTGGNGVAPGGGGGGGYTTTTTGQSGGDGADGQVVLIYSITDPVILPASTLGSVTTFTAPLACTGVNAQAWGAGARGFPAAGGGAATVPNLVGSGSVIGSTCNPKVYNLTDYVAGANQLDSFCGVPVGLTMQKWYWGTTLPTTVGKLPAGLKALAAAGCSILSCFKPSQTLTTANLSNFVAGMKAMIAAGIQYDAILWQEANDGWFPSAAAYHTYVDYYWNTVDPVSGVAANSLGIGLVFDPGFSSGQSSAISYYSGGPITGGPFNAVVCDWYCINGFGDGTGVPKHPLDPIAALADNDGIPFGLGEWGVTATPTPPADLFTGGAYQAYVNYIISFFQNRANRYAIVYYDGAHNTTFNVVTSASDPRAAGIAQVYNALATGSTSSAAGGGGGEYASVPSLSLTAGKSYAVVVGAGGSSSGKNGGNSTVQGDAALVVAHGGLGATSASVGGLGGTGSTNTVHHDGGQGGAGGNQGAGGGGGGSGGTSATGNPGLPGSIGGGGAAAVTGGGPGGNGGSSTSDGSPPAIGPGGGGGGRGITGNFNGQGYDGQVSLSSFVINGVGCAGLLGLAGIAFQGTASAAQNGSFALAPIAFSAKGQVGKLTFVQAGTIASATSSVTLTCASTKANSLVLACLVVNSNTALTAPAGWTRIVAQACSGATAGREEVWFYNPSTDGVTGANPGGITSVVFSSGGPSLAGHLLEFSPPAGYVPVLDGTPGSTSAAGPATSFPVTQSPGPTAGGDLGVSFFENRFSATTSGTWTTPTGWTQARQGSATANWQASFYNNLSSGAQSVTAGASTGTNETGWAASIVTFSISPLITSSGGLVLSGLGFHASGNAVVGPGQVVSSGGLQLAPLSFQSPSLANAFPLAGSLPIMVELQINGTWVDISDLVYQRDDITITGRGVPNEATVPQPAQCSMTLNNRGGVFSPQNASGPFFPYLIRNTRIRVSVVNVVSALGATYTGYRFQGEVPAWPVLWDETGQDIYVQVTAVGILQRMAQSKSSASPLLRYYQGLTDGLIPAGYWPCEDGSQAGSFASGIPGGSPMTWGTPAPGLSADTSAAGSAAFAQLNGSAWIGTPGAFSSGGQTFQNPGTFTWFCPNGITSVDVQCWGAGGGGSNGKWGTGGAGGEFAEDTAIGVTPGNTYTFNVGFGGSGGAGAFQPNGNAGNKGGNTTFSGDSKKVRAHGGSGGPDSSSGSASGGTGSTNPIHFDGGNGSSNDAGNAGSGGGSSAGVSSSGHTGSHGSGQTGGAGGTAVAGGGPGGAGGAGGTANTGNTATNGLLPFPGPGGGGGGGGFNGYNNYCKPGGSGQSGQVTINFGTQIPTPTANVLRAIIDVPAGGGVDGARLLEALTTGTVADLYILYHTAGSGSFELVGKDSGGHQLFTSGSISFSANGRPLMVSAELVQQSFGGPNIAWKLHAIVPGGTGDVKVATGTIPGALGNFTSVKTNSASPSETGATGIGHIAVQYQIDSLINLAPAFGAYIGELAADRLTRLCADNNIPFELFGTNTDTPQMGPQPTDLLLNILLDCMNTDLGQLFETRDQFGLGYQTRQNMQNQAQQVILDYSLGQLVLPLAPTDDDQMTRNDVIATRGSPASSLNNGSSFEAVLNSGPMSTQDPPNGVGLYQYTVTVNVFQDSQLQNFATWILTIGTLDEFRYPIITLDLTRPEVAGDVFGEIAGMDITDFLSIINPPAQLPQYTINQLAFGFSESLNFKKWTISINAVPEDPYSGANLPIW